MIFISYATPDRQTAYNIVEFLEGKGYPCFIAPRDIVGGKAYASVLMNALDSCEAVLLVASEAINASEHVLNEVDVIIEKRKPLFPVFIEDFQLGQDYRYYLGRKQCIIAYPDGVENYYPKILTAISGVASEPVGITADEPAVSKATKTIFEYNPQRGIMINPEDHQRNVSFRTDTFINMMGGIYEKVSAIAGAEEAEKIFFESGYNSGKNFAERIDAQWSNSDLDLFDSIKAKFKKWCEFDSAVGWGNFSSEIAYDEENNCLAGNISINEAFIVDNKGKRKICNFIKGYCSGVAETLLGSVEVELVCKECPLKNKFHPKCVFSLKTID